jgi:hypothetical protein
MLTNNESADVTADMVKYQFEIDDDEWEAWKRTVPRTKSLDERVRELIRADTDGRVEDDTSEQKSEPVERSPRHQPVEGVERAQLRDELAEAVPSSGDLAKRRADEILKMYDVLRERGEAEKSDLLGVVDVEATEYASAASVWSNMVKGRETLRALPGVKTPPEGKTTWRYSDGD